MATARVLNHVLLRKNSIFKIYGASVNNACNYSQKSVAPSKQRESGQIQTDFAETVKENTKSAWYLGVIVAGAGILSVVLYAIFKELFSSKSPNGVYAKAVKRILKEPEVVELLGEPIKAHGEETRRGRRGHVAHTLYLKDSIPHMRMQFYVKGSRTSGTVYLEVRENQSGDHEYRYLFLELNDYKKSVIVVEENRSTNASNHMMNFN